MYLDIFLVCFTTATCVLGCFVVGIASATLAQNGQQSILGCCWWAVSNQIDTDWKKFNMTRFSEYAVIFVFCFGLDLLKLFLIVHKHEGPLTPNLVGRSRPLIHYIPFRILTSWGIVGYSVLHKMSHTSQTRHAWKCRWVRQRLQLWGPRNRTPENQPKCIILSSQDLPGFFLLAAGQLYPDSAT